MRVDLFDFDLPPERIALRPAGRGTARGCCWSTATAISDQSVLDLPSLLRPGDVLVFNDTRVIPAQLEGRRGEARDRRDAAQARGPARLVGVRPQRQAAADRRHGRVRRAACPPRWSNASDDGAILLHFHGEEPVELLLERAGRMPLPPYIASRRPADEPTATIIRRCSRARKARSPRRPRRCISPPG